MSGALGAESTLADLDAALIELIDLGELRCGIAAGGVLRFEPVHARAVDLALCRPVGVGNGRGWVEALGGRAAGPSGGPDTSG